VSGNYAYMTLEGGLVVFDVSNPRNPTIIGRYLMGDAAVDPLTGVVRVWRPLDVVDGEGIRDKYGHRLETGSLIVASESLIRVRLRDQTVVVKGKSTGIA